MMLEKSGNTPELRMLSLFDILNDWLQAPSINEHLKQLVISSQAPATLHNYLTRQAQLAKAATPEILAHQIYFMLSSTIKEAISSGQFNGFSHAKLAAKALISAQTDTSDEALNEQTSEEALKKKPQSINASNHLSINKKTLGYSIAATIALCSLGLYMAFSYHMISADKLTSFAQLRAKPSTLLPITTTANSPLSQDLNTKMLSPMQVSSILSKIEQMRKGNCQLLEAIQIPDQHKTIYFNIVVEGEAPKDLRELEIANYYLQKVRCNYTPMLMSNSTN